MRSAVPERLLRDELGHLGIGRKRLDNEADIHLHDRTRWAAHDVRIHTSGTKRMHHPVVGDLDLPDESFPLPGDPGRQSLVTYTAEPASPTEDALNLLASWSATIDAPASTEPSNRSI